MLTNTSIQKTYRHNRYQNRKSIVPEYNDCFRTGISLLHTLAVDLLCNTWRPHRTSLDDLIVIKILSIKYLPPQSLSESQAYCLGMHFLVLLQRIVLSGQGASLKHFSPFSSNSSDISRQSSSPESKNN